MDKKLIVIDDDPQFADLLSEIASTAGYQSTVCNDAREYFDAADQYGIMVLDLNMPTMDGVEVIRRMGAASHLTYVILISGFDSGVLHSAEQLAQEHGLNIVGSLTKPLQISEFLALLNSVADRRKSDFQTPRLVNEPITVNEIRAALRKQEMVLYYQPQIDLRNNTVKGVEALIRWKHPIRGLVPPNDFIPIAEREGLMREVTSYVITQAVTQSIAWQRIGFDLTISVNVSAENITSLSLPEHLSELITDYGLNPQSIVLEITESALMGELKTALDILTRLRMKGFGLSIDDFGTGNSSLVMLHRIPFSELKIDMSFVKNMDKDVDAYAIVETCVMLGHKLHMTVVAEGIESRSIQMSLIQMGCDVGQGYHIAKPMPADDLPKWMLRFKGRELLEA